MVRLKKVFVSPPQPRHGVEVTDNDHTDRFASASTQISVLCEVNKCLQASISATEQKVIKCRDRSGVLAGELRRIQAQKERLEDQLAVAQVNSKLQTSRMQHTEEQGKALRKKINEEEEGFAMKLRSAQEESERRLARSQLALERAEGEKQAAMREIRQLQRRIDESSKEADVERKRGREFEEEKNKFNEQIKNLEARLHDAKLQCSLEKARRLDVKRQVEDALERREKLKRDLLTACSELSSSNSISGRLPGLRNDARNLMARAPNYGAY
ncbi:myosin heavy chain, embryonic smooth muscle isoform-like [Dermacentor albipictus]|uniref:myosin heavy chain, embryonic smooth muscle isoform-like n=1 Tax=Dermacentor albipictus TaxID=60249 RepID=UPI0038FCCE9A